MSRYKLLDQHGLHFVTCTMADWIVTFFILCATITALQAQTPTSPLLDSMNMKVIERHIELEIPSAEKGWFSDRNPESIEAYEWEFARDTFRIHRLQCMLLTAFWDEWEKTESDSAFWKQDEEILFPIIQKRDANDLAIYQETARRYDLLVERYFNLILASPYSGNGRWKTALQQSQEAWLTYRRLMLEVKGQQDDILTVLWLIKLNKDRLLEVFEIYDNLMS